MAKRQTFRGVTIAVLQQMRAVNNGDFTLEFEQHGVSGTVAGGTPLGNVVLHFHYAEERAEMTLTILKKPMFVPFPILWAEFSRTVREAAAALDQAMSGTP